MELNNIQVICDTVDNGIILLDKNLNVHFWNRWLERRTNINFKNIEGKNIKDFFPELNAKKLKRKIDTTLKLNIQTYYTTEVNRYLLNINLNKITNKVFDNMQQSVTISPYDTLNGLVVLYIYDNTMLYESNHTLQTAKEDLEVKNKELNESTSEIDLLLDTTMEAILLYENNICKKVNAKALELFEYEDESELKNKDISELVKDTSFTEFQREHKRTFETKMLKKDNMSFDALVQVKHMQLNKKTLKVVTVMDLTLIKEKDKIMSDQAKMAALGEMLGNIAHQWRQPLSAICTIASGLQFQKEMDLLSDDMFNKSLKDVVNITQHLSDTINDFRDFLKKEKITSKFYIKENIEKTLNIIEEILKSSGIETIISYKDNPLISTYSNELTQALLNILNNSKDALNFLEIDRKYIFIDIYEKDNEAIIEIKDNANGIGESIIEKIFEPYFTTKHKDQGTGLGLYMTHQLIENMNGKIAVSNHRYEYNNHQEMGACFTLSFPLNKNL
jgi:signal transduction histidine kinase